MAKYRNLQTSFWQNNFVLELTPEEKFFYIYLMTNINTTQCGIYTFNIKLSEFETGYSRETIEKLLSRFIEYGKIKYCKATREIMVVNWLKYNFINNKPVISCINKELHEVKNKDFVRELYVYCKDMNLPYQYIFNGLEAVYLGPANRCNTVYIGYGEEEEKEVEKEVEVEKNKEIANGENAEAIEEIGENEETAEKQIETVEEYIGAAEEQTAETEEQIEAAAGKITKVSKKDLKDVVKVFNNNIHPMTPLEYEKLSFWCQLMECEVVIAAIEEAVKNNVRKMAYIEGVLRSWEDNGFKTLGEVEACRRDFKSRKEKNIENMSIPNSKAYELIEEGE